MSARHVLQEYRQLLAELAGQISSRLEATFDDSGNSGPNVAIALRERGSAVVIEVPLEMFASAAEHLAAREALRVRLKARRDRMLFRPPPARLAKHVAPAVLGGGGGHPPWRGRR